ncbi:MAG: hypothetical protein BM558_04665 [Roseobacter sp. MedPE-SW]|nr:MAG: hypothetical protein BM558_04665 [Roseobacter sp. MedPE-SW]
MMISRDALIISQSGSISAGLNRQLVTGLSFMLGGAEGILDITPYRKFCKLLRIRKITARPMRYSIRGANFLLSEMSPVGERTWVHMKQGCQGHEATIPALYGSFRKVIFLRSYRRA